MAAAAEVLKDSNGAGIGAAVEDEVSGKITHVNGVDSMKDNVISLKLDIRYPVTFKGDELFAMMEKYVAEHGAKAVLRKNTSPVYKPADTAEIKTLLAAHDYVTGEKGVPYTIGGGTYAKMLPNVVAFGPLFAGDPVTEHQPDECIDLERLVQNAQIIANAIVKLANLPLE